EQLDSDGRRRPTRARLHRARSGEWSFQRTAGRAQQAPSDHPTRGLLMSFLRRIDWRLLLIFFIVAAIVHIIATFLAVNDQRGTAYARLAELLPHNTMTIADPVGPRHEPLPYL